MDHCSMEEKGRGRESRKEGGGGVVLVVVSKLSFCSYFTTLHPTHSPLRSVLYHG